MDKQIKAGLLEHLEVIISIIQGQYIIINKKDSIVNGMKETESDYFMFQNKRH